MTAHFPIKSFLLASLLTLPVLVQATPARDLNLLSAGWSFNPPSPGACPTPGQDFDCYENRTATGINIIGSDNSSGSNITTLSYTLAATDPSQQVSFNYDFTDMSAASIAYYQLGSNAPSLFVGLGSIPDFQWNPGESLIFVISQNGSNAYAGQLAITSFSSLPAISPTPVPAPLPALGAIAGLIQTRALRRRRKADHLARTTPH
jgi:hypothetical protein